MKKSDIDAVTKKLGGRLLKDANPELYQLELNKGATVQLFSAHHSRSDDQVEPDANATAPQMEPTEAAVIHPEVQAPEAPAAQAEGEDDDWSAEDEDDGTEHCPICGAESDWGSIKTCEHFIGMLFDSSILDCSVLNSLHEAWTTLDRLEAYNAPLLWALAKTQNVDFETFSFYMKHTEELAGDLSAGEILALASELFGLHIGSLTTTGGMLSGSATTIYAENPEFLHALDVGLWNLASEIETADRECRMLHASNP